MPMDNYRSLFQIPEDVHYFNVAGVSPLTTLAREQGIAGVDVKLAPWSIDLDIFFERAEVARRLFAQLIHASDNEIAIVPSATYGVEVAAKNLRLSPGDEILVQADEFPALILPLQRAARASGARIITVARPADWDWTKALTERLTERTKVVAFCPSHWTDGSVVDSRRVSTEAHACGAQVWIDGCQSLGAATFDVRDVQPDFVFAPTYKWLMGPYTYGFLYVKAEKIESMQPLEEYWANRKGAEDFTTLTQYEPQYKDGARKFDMSERSQFINTPIAIAALEFLLKITPQNISENLRPVIARIANEAERKGYQAVPTAFRSPHFIGIRKIGGLSEELKNRLHQAHVHVGYRGDCMRISPHLYNSKQDVEILLEHL